MASTAPVFEGVIVADVNLVISLLTAQVVDQYVNAEQEDPYRQNRDTPAEIVAPDQQEERQDKTQDGDPARGYPGTDHDRRCRDHEYARHLDRVGINDDVDG